MKGDKYLEPTSDQQYQIPEDKSRCRYVLRSQTGPGCVEWRGVGRATRAGHRTERGGCGSRPSTPKGPSVVSLDTATSTGVRGDPADQAGVGRPRNERAGWWGRKTTTPVRVWCSGQGVCLSGACGLASLAGGTLAQGPIKPGGTSTVAGSQSTSGHCHS